MVAGDATPVGGDITDASGAYLAPLSSNSYCESTTVESRLPSPVEGGLTEHPYRRSMLF
jgi:hypothetical protein